PLAAIHWLAANSHARSRVAASHHATMIGWNGRRQLTLVRPSTPSRNHGGAVHSGIETAEAMESRRSATNASVNHLQRRAQILFAASTSRWFGFLPTRSSISSRLPSNLWMAGTYLSFSQDRKSTRLN